MLVNVNIKAMPELKEPKTLREIQMEPSDIPGAPSGQKREKNKVKEKLIEVTTGGSVDYQITKIEVTAKGRVKVGFGRIENNPNFNIDPENPEDSFLDTDFTVNSKRGAHADLLNAMKRLRKPALEICELEVDTKRLSDYTVSCVKISGDMTKKKSRVVFTIAHAVRKTGKIVYIGPSPQTTMYGESEHEGVEAMTAVIEEVIAEAWLYLGGKCDINEQVPDNQLPLFVR